MRKSTIVLIAAALMLVFTAPAASAAMNEGEHRSASLVNVERREAGVPRVTPQACLQRYAEAHARRMANAKKMYHQSSAQFRTIMRECKLRSIGENVARGTNLSSTQVVRNWMGSKGHRANILKRDFNRIGASYRTGSNGQRYWIHLFGRTA